MMPSSRLSRRLWLGLACVGLAMVLMPVSVSHGVQATQPSPPCARSAGQAAGLAYRMSEFGRCQQDAQLPLVISLHGMGDRPRELFSEVPVPVRIVAPRAPKPYGTGFSWFSHRSQEVPGHVLAPEIRDTADRMAKFIVEMQKRYPTAGRPVITGVSQGGMISFAVALHHPEAVGEAFPVAGWLPEELWTKRRHERAASTFAMHGELDKVVPLAGTAQMVQMLASRGHPVELETYADAGHHMTPAMHARRYLQLMRVLRNK